MQDELGENCDSEDAGQRCENEYCAEEDVTFPPDAALGGEIVG